MAGLKLGEDVLIDRHHRGAMVFVACRTFALPEQAIALVERIQKRAGPYQALNENERSLATELVAHGILIEDET